MHMLLQDYMLIADTTGLLSSYQDNNTTIYFVANLVRDAWLYLNRPTLYSTIRSIIIVAPINIDQLAQQSNIDPTNYNNINITR